MTKDILSQVRAMKENGRLSEIAALYDNVTFTESQLLARFVLMVLEQSNGTHPELQAFGSWLKENENNGTMYHMAIAALRVYLRDVLPPIPALDDIEARAERAANNIYDDMHNWDLNWPKLVFITEMASVITVAMRGEI